MKFMEDNWELLITYFIQFYTLRANASVGLKERVHDMRAAVRCLLNDSYLLIILSNEKEKIINGGWVRKDLEGGRYRKTISLGKERSCEMNQWFNNSGYWPLRMAPITSGLTGGVRSVNGTITDHYIVPCRTVEADYMAHEKAQRRTQAFFMNNNTDFIEQSSNNRQLKGHTALVWSRPLKWKKSKECNKLYCITANAIHCTCYSVTPTLWTHTRWKVITVLYLSLNIKCMKSKKSIWNCH